MTITPSSSKTFTPITSASSFSPSPSASWSSIAAAQSSASVAPSDEYDCTYKDYGCNWEASDYTHGSDYCGSSAFSPGQKLSDGHVVLAVSKDGSGDCASQAGSQCCKFLANHPCKRGEKYLDCVKP
jgi:hypothetical protein